MNTLESPPQTEEDIRLTIARRNVERNGIIKNTYLTFSAIYIMSYLGKFFSPDKYDDAWSCWSKL